MLSKKIHLVKNLGSMPETITSNFPVEINFTAQKWSGNYLKGQKKGDSS